MKTKITFLLILFSILNSFSQKYESAYYINNLGIKLEGFIRNNDWKNNPTSFEFKKTLDDISTNILIESCKEFSITNGNKYTRAKVNIEKSTTNIQDMGHNKEPVFFEETLFLKNLVTGKKSLFSYYDSGLEKFFYSNEDNIIKQLIYIKYLIDINDVKYKEEYKNFEPNSVLANEYFKKQLWLDVRCAETLATEPSKVKYTSDDLKKYFIKINNCNGSTEKVDYVVKKTITSIKAVALINKSKVAYETATYNNELDENINLGIGVDFEFLFPFNNYKWSLFIEPSYNSYNKEMNVSYGLNGTLTQTAKLKMNYIQVPIGVRYYFDISNNSKIFLGTGFNATIINDGTKIDFENSSDIEISGFTYNFTFSMGYKYKRISAELRYLTNNNISNTVNFSRVNLGLKYEIFKK